MFMKKQEDFLDARVTWGKHLISPPFTGRKLLRLRKLLKSLNKKQRNFLGLTGKFCQELLLGSIALNLKRGLRRASLHFYADGYRYQVYPLKTDLKGCIGKELR